MDYYIGLIGGGISCLLGIFLIHSITYQDNITTPAKVAFATESCKFGKWKTISKNTITCEDGTVYKYTLED
jgi:hypothetical protein